PGQIVAVMGGTYGYQEVNLDRSKTSSRDVVFQPQAHARVTVETLAFGDGFNRPAASHVTVNNMTVLREIQFFSPARDLTWKNINGGSFYIRGTSNLTIVGGDWGPCTSSTGTCSTNNKIDADPQSRNITISVARLLA